MTLHQEQMDNVTPLRPKTLRAYPMGVEFEYSDREMQLVQMQRDISQRGKDRAFWLLFAVGLCVGVWSLAICAILWAFS